MTLRLPKNGSVMRQVLADPIPAQNIVLGRYPGHVLSREPKGATGEIEAVGYMKDASSQYCLMDCNAGGQKEYIALASRKNFKFIKRNQSLAVELAYLFIATRLPFFH